MENPAAILGKPGKNTRVMIEKFAAVDRESGSARPDLNHRSNFMNLVSLLLPKFASDPTAIFGKLGKTARVMIEKFAGVDASPGANFRI